MEERREEIPPPNTPGYRGLRLNSLRRRMQKSFLSANILQLYDCVYDHENLGRSCCQEGLELKLHQLYCTQSLPAFPFLSSEFEHYQIILFPTLKNYTFEVMNE